MCEVCSKKQIDKEYFLCLLFFTYGFILCIVYVAFLSQIKQNFQNMIWSQTMKKFNFLEVAEGTMKRWVSDGKYKSAGGGNARLLFK